MTFWRKGRVARRVDVALRSEPGSPAPVTAVIPSLGRPSLAVTVQSMLGQTRPPAEIIVVNDSPAQKSITAGMAPTVKEIYTGGLVGCGPARTLGVSEASQPFIAYLDDDDQWRPHHLENAMAWLSAHPEVDIYASRMLIRYPNGEKVASRALYRGRQSVIDFYYGATCWAGRRRSIHNGTWVYRREIADDAVQEEPLSDREDIWWLIMQDQRGRKIYQSRDIGGIWFEDPDRTFGRFTMDATRQWAALLDSVEKGAGSRFLFGVMGRAYALRGMRQEVQNLREVAEDPSPAYRALGWIELIVASVFARLPREFRRGHIADR